MSPNSIRRLPRPSVRAPHLQRAVPPLAVPPIESTVQTQPALYDDQSQSLRAPALTVATAPQARSGAPSEKPAAVVSGDAPRALLLSPASSDSRGPTALSSAAAGGQRPAILSRAPGETSNAVAPARAPIARRSGKQHRVALPRTQRAARRTRLWPRVHAGSNHACEPPDSRGSVVICFWKSSLRCSRTSGHHPPQSPARHSLSPAPRAAR